MELFSSKPRASAWLFILNHLLAKDISDAPAPPKQKFNGITFAHNVRTKKEVDQLLAQAQKAGDKIEKPAKETDWGGFSGYFSDPDGYLWEIAYGFRISSGWKFDYHIVTAAQPSSLLQNDCSQGHHACFRRGIQNHSLAHLQDTPTAFGSTYAKESQLSDADWQRRAAQWSSDRCISYLAWDDEQPCGIVAGMIQENDPAKAFLLSMWVAPTHRRRGIGQQLVRAVIEWMKQRPIDTLMLDVTCNNGGAIDFYEHLGFTKTGQTKPYPNDPALVELEMVRQLG